MLSGLLQDNDQQSASLFIKDCCQKNTRFLRPLSISYIKNKTSKSSNSLSRRSFCSWFLGLSHLGCLFRKENWRASTQGQIQWWRKNVFSFSWATYYQITLWGSWIKINNNCSRCKKIFLCSRHGKIFHFQGGWKLMGKWGVTFISSGSFPWCI